jgi:hypothetical protein
VADEYHARAEQLTPTRGHNLIALDTYAMLPGDPGALSLVAHYAAWNEAVAALLRAVQEPDEFTRFYIYSAKDDAPRGPKRAPAAIEVVAYAARYRVSDMQARELWRVMSASF